MSVLLILFLFIVGVEAQAIQKSHLSVIKKRVITGGGAITATDDFSVDPSSRWTVETGSVAWQVSTEDLDQTGNPGVYRFNTALGADEGYVKVNYKNGSQPFGGIVFRYTQVNGEHYVVRSNDSGVWAWRYCTDGSCTDIETKSGESDPPTVYGIHYSGTGASTEVELWIGGIGDDYTAWGIPDHTFTNDPGGNARDTGDDVGLYSGSVQEPTFDDWYIHDGN